MPKSEILKDCTLMGRGWLKRLVDWKKLVEKVMVRESFWREMRGKLCKDREVVNYIYVVWS